MLKGWEEKKERCSLLPEDYLFIFTLLICVCWGGGGERERLRGETHAHAYIYGYMPTCLSGYIEVRRQLMRLDFLSLFTIWFSGIKLWLSGLVAIPLPTESFYQPIIL